MDEKELEAWQTAAKYQANVCYLRSILDLIKETMMVYHGRELRERITELIDEGKRHTQIIKE